MKDTFANRLKELMSKSLYTQKQLSEIVGVTEAAFSRYMTTDRIPKAEIVANLATALQTTTDYLLTGSNPYTDFASVNKSILARSSEKLSDEQRNELILLLESINKRLESK